MKAAKVPLSVLREPPENFNEGPIPLFETFQAMQSLRRSGHTFFSAVGELVDNSQEAQATKIQIVLEPKNKEKGLARVVVSDDGNGMNPHILPMAIGLGSSTRYDSRKGIGRFGVGATLGSISQASFMEYYSKEKSGEIYSTYLDLDSLGRDQRNVIPSKPKKLPSELAHLLKDQGTVVVLERLDLFDVDGKHQDSVNITQLKSHLMHWLGRTYRKFIDAGLKIYVNGTEVLVWDPLFSMENTRFPKDPKAEVLLDEEHLFEKEGKKGKVRIIVSLLPEFLRMQRGRANPLNNPEIRDRKVDENEGFSIVRNQREIFFGTLPRFLGNASQDIDRFIGKEISFEASLDEFFAVKHVKKGAEPIEELRDFLKEKMKTVIEHARKRIQRRFDETDKDMASENGAHDDAERAAAEYEKISPKGQVGADKTKESVQETIDRVADLVVKSGAVKGQTVEDVKKKIDEKPFTLLEAVWPGKEFMSIDHIARSKAIITLNHGHPFYTHVYQPIMRAAGYVDDGSGGASEPLSQAEFRLIKNALDLLLISYAKAEGMNETALHFHEELRNQWGVFLAGMIKEGDNK